MNNIKKVEVGGFLNFKNLKELDSFCKTPQFKTQRFEYAGGVNVRIKRTK